MLSTLTSLQDVQQLYDWFAHMRETQPVWRDERSGFWHVFRYDVVYRVTTDFGTFSSEVMQRRQPRTEDGRILLGRSLIAMDPPHHRKYRELVSPAFTPRALARLSGRIAEITQGLLAEVKPQGRNDPEALPDGVNKDVMTVHDQEYQDGDKILKLGYDGHLFIIHGIDHIHDGEAHLKTDKLARKLDPVEDQTGAKTNHDADHDLTRHAEYHREDISAEFPSCRGNYGIDQKRNEKSQPPLYLERYRAVSHNGNGDDHGTHAKKNQNQYF